MRSLSSAPGLFKRLYSNETIILLTQVALGGTVIRLAGMVLTFLVGVQLAHLLGVSGYGTYGFAISIIAILTIPTQFGFPQLLVREVSSAKADDNWKKVFGLLAWFNSMSLRLSLIMVATAGICLWMLVSNGNLASSTSITLAVGLFTIPLATQIVIQGATLRGVDCIVSSHVIDAIVQPGLMSLFIFLLASLSDIKSPEFAMAARWGSLFVSLIAACFVLKYALPKKQEMIGEDNINTKQMLYSAFPMAMTEGMRVLQGHVLAVILGLVSSAYSVGIYKIASSTILLISLPLTIVNLTISPMVSKAYTNRDSEKLKVILLFSAISMTLGVAVLTLPFVFFGDQLLLYVFGEGFQKSNASILIMAAGVLISGTFGANITFLNMCRQDQVVAKTFVFSLILTVVTAFPLIFFFSEIGAATTHSIVMIVTSAYLYLKTKHVC